MRRASLNGWIGRSSRWFNCATACSRRRRRYQRTEGNRKCDAKVTAANSRIRRNSQRGSVTGLVMARDGGRKGPVGQWVPNGLGQGDVDPDQPVVGGRRGLGHRAVGGPEDAGILQREGRRRQDVVDAQVAGAEAVRVIAEIGGVEGRVAEMGIVRSALAAAAVPPSLAGVTEVLTIGRSRSCCAAPGMLSPSLGRNSGRPR
jgi:hypothetical protein